MKTREPVSYLYKRDGSLITTDKEKTDTLNNQFASVFTEKLSTILDMESPHLTSDLDVILLDVIIDKKKLN